MTDSQQPTPEQRAATIVRLAKDAVALMSQGKGAEADRQLSQVQEQVGRLAASLDWHEKSRALLVGDLADLNRKVDTLTEERNQARSELAAAMDARDQHERARNLLASELKALADGEPVRTMLAESVQAVVDAAHDEAEALRAELTAARPKAGEVFVRAKLQRSVPGRCWIEIEREDPRLLPLSGHVSPTAIVSPPPTLDRRGKEVSNEEICALLAPGPKRVEQICEAIRNAPVASTVAECDMRGMALELRALALAQSAELTAATARAEQAEAKLAEAAYATDAARSQLQSEGIRLQEANNRHSETILQLAEAERERDDLHALFQRTHGVHHSWVAEADKARALRAERDAAVARCERLVGAATMALAVMRAPTPTDREGYYDYVPERRAVAALQAALSEPAAGVEPPAVSWENGGGPNECEHGYAAGLPCPDCDAAKGPPRLEPHGPMPAVAPTIEYLSEGKCSPEEYVKGVLVRLTDEEMFAAATTVGRRVRYYRLKAGKTMGDLARCLGISVTRVSDLERDLRGQPGWTVLTKIAAFVGVAESDLVPPAEPIDNLIARSSLGTPEAVAARAEVPAGIVDRVLARADELDREGAATIADFGIDDTVQINSPGHAWDGKEGAVVGAEPPTGAKVIVLSTFGSRARFEPKELRVVRRAKDSEQKEGGDAER